MIERARRAGATYEQIGEALGVSRQAVHARLRRAKVGSLAVLALADYDELIGACLSLLP
jgi:DNA-directed RNA polymerase specialized sigma24 family protein